MQPTIVEQYHSWRKACENYDERNALWRAYAWATIEEFSTPARKREIAALNVALENPRIIRRTVADKDLPVRFKPYWAAIPLIDLQELWLTLERSRSSI